LSYRIQVQRNGHLTLSCAHPNCFEGNYADCDERAERRACKGNNTWVGGFERTVDGKLYLQCCKFELLPIYGERLLEFVKVRRGQFFEGKTKTVSKHDNYVIYFDVITNIRRVGNLSPRDVRNEHYELSVTRYTCGREPEFKPAWIKPNPWPFFDTKEGAVI
ncbi:hypothetical protein PENTCL1PPCAC_14704, partial [Pristionchus entomophagus]